MAEKKASTIQELVVPLTVVAIVCSVVVPLPAALLDFLLVGNLVLALALLVSALSITDTMKLSSLPTMLLLATLYRLCLNISTTRLILSSRDVGEAIKAFGSLVIDGNVAVGLVVFLVLTLIQFIVVAKGSERVAEVAARFTLDAMPGKQMSIDADVRAGLFDYETARMKRQELQAESRFYGALDGAMKFVKGDALAGLIIVGINIIGGFCVGVLSDGLSFQQAISKYTLLTVGDGLLSQIPSLLNSLAAGLVVTRVARGDSRSVGVEMASQLLDGTRVKLVVGGCAGLLALVDAMPKTPLLSLSALLLFSAYSGSKREKRELAGVHPECFRPKAVPPLSIELGGDVIRAFSSAKDLRAFAEGVRERVFAVSGVFLGPIPRLPYAGDSARVSLKIRGISTSLFVPELAGDGIDARLLDAIATRVAENRLEFLDDQMTRRLLDFFDEEAPELVSSVVPGVVTLTQLTEVLKGLAREEISLRHFDMILQAVAEHGARAANERYLLEEVRIALRRVISNDAAQNGVIRGYLVEPILDMAIARAERERSPVDVAYFDVIATAVSEQPAGVLLVSRAARRLIRESLELRGIKIRVLAHEELAPEVTFERAGVIELRDARLEEEVLERLAA